MFVAPSPTIIPTVCLNDHFQDSPQRISFQRLLPNYRLSFLLLVYEYRLVRVNYTITTTTSWSYYYFLFKPENSKAYYKLSDLSLKYIFFLYITRIGKDKIALEHDESDNESRKINFHRHKKNI